MAGNDFLFGNYALNAVRDRILEDTCADLKARVMAVIEPEIDEACRRAVKSLEPQINHFRDFAVPREIIQIVVTQRSPKA